MAEVDCDTAWLATKVLEWVVGWTAHLSPSRRLRRPSRVQTVALRAMYPLGGPRFDQGGGRVQALGTLLLVLKRSAIKRLAAISERCPFPRPLLFTNG